MLSRYFTLLKSFVYNEYSTNQLSFYMKYKKHCDENFSPSYLILYIDTYNQPLQDSPEHLIIQTRWVSSTFLIKNKNIKLNFVSEDSTLKLSPFKEQQTTTWNESLAQEPSVTKQVSKQAWTPFLQSLNSLKVRFNKELETFLRQDMRCHLN